MSRGMQAAQFLFQLADPLLVGGAGFALGSAEAVGLLGRCCQLCSQRIPVVTPVFQVGSGSGVVEAEARPSSQARLSSRTSLYPFENAVGFGGQRYGLVFAVHQACRPFKLTKP